MHVSNELNAGRPQKNSSPSRFASHGAGFALGLTAARANGTMWELSLEDDRTELRRLQNREQHELLVGSPPSGDFSSMSTCMKLQELCTMKAERIEAHIRTSVQAYKLQMEMQKHLIHEHLKDAASWRMPEVQFLPATRECTALMVRCVAGA